MPTPLRNFRQSCLKVFLNSSAARFAAGFLALAVLPVAAQDKPITPLRTFTTLQVEDVRIAPELTGLKLHVTTAKGPSSSDPSEAAEAIRSSIVEHVMDRHKFWRVTDVRQPEKVTPPTEPDDVRVRRRGQSTYGKGPDERFRHRADFEDAEVAKPATERILLLRCELVALQPGGKAKRLLAGAMFSRDQITARCQLVDKADGNSVSEFQVQGAIELKVEALVESASGCKATVGAITYGCYKVIDTREAVLFGNFGDEVAKAVERGW